MYFILKKENCIFFHIITSAVREFFFLLYSVFFSLLFNMFSVSAQNLFFPFCFEANTKRKVWQCCFALSFRNNRSLDISRVFNWNNKQNIYPNCIQSIYYMYFCCHSNKGILKYTHIKRKDNLNKPRGTSTLT